MQWKKQYKWVAILFFLFPFCRIIFVFKEKIILGGIIIIIFIQKNKKNYVFTRKSKIISIGKTKDNYIVGAFGLRKSIM